LSLVQYRNNRDYATVLRCLSQDTYDPSNLRDFTDQLLLLVDSGDDSGLLQQEDMDYLLLDMAGYGFQEVAVTLTWMLGFMALHHDIQGH
jgi:hypothetical protein